MTPPCTCHRPVAVAGYCPLHDPGPQCPSTSHDTDGGWRCEHRAGHDPKVKHKNREKEW